MTDLKLPPRLHAERAARRNKKKQQSNAELMKRLEAMSVRYQKMIDYMEGLERFIVGHTGS
jgi:hypothetical protein